jgi:hypothetical protein
VAGKSLFPGGKKLSRPSEAFNVKYPGPVDPKTFECRDINHNGFSPELHLEGIMHNVFEGPRLKIRRAQDHVNSLKIAIDDYFARDPWAILLQRNNKTGGYRLVLKGREQVPADFSLIFGDAVHNFRTALDILANDAVRATGAVPKKVYFPFGQDAQGFEDQLIEKMKQAPENVRAIIRSFKPFTGGNETLRAMHDLDIGDKHIALMNVNTATATPPLPMVQTGYERVSGERPNRLTFGADFSALKTAPIDLAGFPADPTPDFETLGKLVGSEPDLVISNNLPLAGQPVLKVLNEMGVQAQLIVETFEAALFKASHG